MTANGCVEEMVMLELRVGMSEPVTKQDLADAVREIYDRIERTENNLLSAFYGWARTMEVKVRSLHAFDERLSVVEERLAELERKQYPPH